MPKKTPIESVGAESTEEDLTEAEDERIPPGNLSQSDEENHADDEDEDGEESLNASGEEDVVAIVRKQAEAKPRATGLSMVLEVMALNGNPRNGASLQLIKKMVGEKYNVTERTMKRLKIVINKAVESGELLCVSGTGANGSFKLPPAAKKPGKQTKSALPAQKSPKKAPAKIQMEASPKLPVKKATQSNKMPVAKQTTEKSQIRRAVAGPSKKPLPTSDSESSNYSPVKGAKSVTPKETGKIGPANKTKLVKSFEPESDSESSDSRVKNKATDAPKNTNKNIAATKTKPVKSTVKPTRTASVDSKLNEKRKIPLGRAPSPSPRKKSKQSPGKPTKKPIPAAKKSPGKTVKNSVKNKPVAQPKMTLKSKK